MWLYGTIKSKRYESNNELEISVSCDEGHSWPIRRSVYSGPCNYSDLAVMPDHTVVLLLGAGAYEHNRAFAKEARLVRIRLAGQAENSMNK
ncbi:MAG: repeat-like domain [Paenibacillaceae bacterium]|nr:repeat-like domain [Paenibacillaceae bacterium]